MVVKSPFMVVKSPFMVVKSPFMVVKSPFIGSMNESYSNCHKPAISEKAKDLHLRGRIIQARRLFRVSRRWENAGKMGGKSMGNGEDRTINGGFFMRMGKGSANR